MSLFASALLAATILPFYSEFAVGGAIVAGYAPLAVWWWASAGNTVGALINGVIGRAAGNTQVREKLRISEPQYTKARQWYQRFGVWSLLLAWLPVGGDALTVVAGAMRVRWSVFIALVFIGKSARYAVLIALLGTARESM